MKHHQRRLFHVSEEPGISAFVPRSPARADMNSEIGLVWALCERTLPNYLTPRDCPRVTYHARAETREEDIAAYMPKGYRHVVIIETGWLKRLEETTLYVYEFEPGGFYLQDEAAGYYVSESTQAPIKITVVSDLKAELARRNTALQTRDSLWGISEEIKKTSFYWSICRMGNAKGA
ncbi:MAG: hypothetical protein LBS36_01200 [Oscillospiraceae bacterium]|nr:hypothetical protein [Oscillospiraceae bacterium]